MSMLEMMEQELRSIEEAIEYEELNDRAYLKWYTYLLRKRRILKRSIRDWKKVNDKMDAASERAASTYGYAKKIG